MDNAVYQGYIDKLKNKLYGLLCEYEKNREWEKYLDSIQIELNGFPEERRSINYYSLCHKVNSLRYLSYKYFRSTIFECMGMFDRV